MKPISLTMSAFGPYSGVERIDFRQLDKGLFLIMGDTGSGKTTIFDGIVFALYGEASGSIRQSSMLRSDFAEEETETFVELTFENYGKTYYIKRSPEYFRKKKRGEGYTKKAGEAVLQCPDGRVISKYSDVTAEVTEILGVTKEQFTNIAMIAQGDFLKLILAKTEERSKIFRDIFNTGRFLNVQKKLEQEMKERYAANKTFENSIFQYAGDTTCDVHSEYYPQYRNLLEERNIHAMEVFTELIEKIILEEEQNQKTIEDRKDKKEKELESINDMLRLWKEYQENEQKLQELHRKVEENERAAAELSEERIILQQDKAMREETYLKVSQLTSQLEEYALLDKTYQEKETCSRQKKEIVDKLKQCDTEKKKAEKELETLNDIRHKFNDSVLQQKEYEIRYQEYAVKDKLLTDLSDKYSEAERIRRDYEAAKADYLEQEVILREAKEDADRKEALFLREQAGIMAEDLAEGEKCPVCGSLEHPAKAVISANAPTQEEVKRAKTFVETNRAALQQAAEKCSHTKGLLEKAAEEYERRLYEAGEVQSIHQIKNMKQQIEQDILAIKRDMQKVNDFIQKYEHIEEWIDKQKRDFDALVSDREKYQQMQKECEVQFVSLETMYENIRKGLKFAARKEADREIKVLEKFIHNYDKRLNDMTEQEYKLTRERTRYDTEIKLYTKEKQSNGRKLRNALNRLAENDSSMQADIFDETYMEQLKHMKSDTEKDISKLEKCAGNCEYRIRSNKNAVSRIRSGMKEREAVLAELLMYQKLSNVANGTISGKEKITFERYVQGTYFEYIIMAANKRLAEMTEGRYELLKRKDNNLRSQAGLELDIKDAYTGKIRSVNTLSGGEAFKAALSMALGLSDVVQSYAGGIRIDSMFIDEGFGSLDRESLEKAIQILNRLGNGERMIGIISHVNELGEWIDKKLMIEKSSSGSRIV